MFGSPGAINIHIWDIYVNVTESGQQQWALSTFGYCGNSSNAIVWCCLTVPRQVNHLQLASSVFACGVDGGKECNVTYKPCGLRTHDELCNRLWQHISFLCRLLTYM